MAIKKKASTPSAGKGSASKLPWRTQADELIVARIIGRTCEVIFLAESDRLCSAFMDKIDVIADSHPAKDIFYLKYNDLLDIIKYCAGHKDIEITNGELLKLSCDEAMSFLSKNENIPCELLAYIIKLKIMSIVQEDVASEQQELFLEKAKQEEHQKLLSSIDSMSGDGKKKGKKGKKGKGGKDKKSKKGEKGSKKSSKKGKKKGKGESKDGSCNINMGEPRLSSPFKHIPAHPEITVEIKDICVVLTGFYDANLIRELVTVGVPLHCIVELTSCKSALFEKIKITEKSAEKSVEEASVDVASIEVTQTRDAVIEDFWKSFVDLYYGQEQHKFLENIAHQICHFKENAALDIWNTENYEMLQDAFRAVKDNRRQHVNYVRNLKIQDLGERPLKINVNKLEIYNKLMNKFPPECFSIAILLACLVEEVNCRTQDVVLIKTGSNSSVVDDTSNEALLSDDTSERSSTKSEEIANTNSTREQVNELLRRYKRRHYPKKDKELYRCCKCCYNPRIDIEINRKPYFINERDQLQIMANCYKQICRKLYFVNLNGLRKGKSALLRKQFSFLTDMERLMNKYNIENWKKDFKLTQEEIEDILQIFVLISMCNQNNEELKLKDAVSDVFPHRSLEDLVNLAKPEEIEFSDNGSNLASVSTVENISDLSLTPVPVFNPTDFIFKEYLTPSILLQELAKADSSFLCVEYRYCTILDTILLRFHNGLDDFGCSTRVWDQSLRYPVCFKDFCKYVVHEEGPWLEEQERIYEEEYRKELELIQWKKEEALKIFNQSVILKDEDFILPNSFKKQLSDLATDTVMDKKDKKEKKGKKGKKGSKEASKKGKKKEGSDTQPSPVQQKQKVKEVEAILGDATVPSFEKFSLRCALPNEPFSFIAYDCWKSLVKRSDSSTIFESEDGVRVTVERLAWLGVPEDVSIKVECNNHMMVLHNPAKKQKPFLFHFALSDDTIITFSKPTKLLPTEVALCKRICQTINKNMKQKNNDNTAFVKKKQEVFFVSVKQDYVVKGIEIPFTTNKCLILSDKLLSPFLDTLEKMNVKTHITISADTVRNHQKRRHNLANRTRSGIVTSDTELYTEIRRSDLINIKPKKKSTVNAIVTKTSSMNFRNSEDISLYTYPENKISKLNGIPSLEKLVATRNEFFQNLKKAVEHHIPVFKICSSKLHKYHYIKRCKSYLNIPIGTVIKRILYKPAYRKTNRQVKVTKCFPLGPSVSTKNKTEYDLRISSPSGLVIKNIPGIGSEYSCIKQQYLDKGPGCKQIQHEESRVFLRNGTVAIKKCDGNIEIFHLNGNIIQFEIPYIMQARAENIAYKKQLIHRKKRLSCASGTVIQACTRSLKIFQKFLRRTLRRQYKHLMRSDMYFRSRNAHLFNQKKHCKDPHQFYLMQTAKEACSEFKLLTSDGRKVKVTDRLAYQEQKYYVSIERDFRSEETLFEREDGTHSILNRDGVLETQFPDGTRIKTWYIEEEDLLFLTDPIDFSQGIDVALQINVNSLDDMDRLDDPYDTEVDDGDYSSNRLLMRSVSEEALKDDDGWVSIHMYYEFKHPNYATVVYGGTDNEMTITMPNGNTIKNFGNGPYHLIVDETLEAKCTSDQVVLYGKRCTACSGMCGCIFNIKPLYCSKHTFSGTDNFLYVEDSFGKKFTADYRGHCKKHLIAKDIIMNKLFCKEHAYTSERLFSVKKDFSGHLYWDKLTYKKLKDMSVSNLHVNVDELVKEDKEEPAMVEIRKYGFTLYPELFRTNYGPKQLLLSKYTGVADRSPVPYYNTHLVLLKLVDRSRIEEIYGKLLESRKELDDKYEKLELFLNELSKDNLDDESEDILQRREDSSECSKTCVCNVENEFRSTKTLYQKWYEWQEECKKYKKLIHEQYVPLYFKSQFGQEYTSESKEQKVVSEASVAPPDKPESGNIIDNKSNLSQVEQRVTGREISKTSHQTTLTVRKHTTKQIVKTDSKTVETLKEEVSFSGPENVVVLCNHGGNVSLDHKLMILTNVSKSSKAAITKEFEKLNSGEVTKFELDDKHTLILKGGTQTCLKQTGACKCDCACNEVVAASNEQNPVETPATIPVYNQEQDVLCLTELSPVTFTTEPLNYKSNPKINDKIRSAASKIAADFFDKYPNLNTKEQDELIHTVMRKSNLKENDYASLCEALRDEILNGAWMENFYLGDSYFEISNKNNKETVELPASDVIRMLVKTLKNRISKMTLVEKEKMNDIINLGNAEQHEVSYIIGNFLSSITEKLKHNSGKLTWEKRLLIIDKALKGVAALDLKPQELDSFLRGLDEAVDDEICKLQSRRDSSDSAARSDQDSENLRIAEKKVILDSLIKSIKKFEFSTFKAKDYVGATDESIADEELIDQSTLIPVERMGGVLGQYTRFKNDKLLTYHVPNKKKQTKQSTSSISILNELTGPASLDKLEPSLTKFCSKRVGLTDTTSTVSSNVSLLLYKKRDSITNKQLTISSQAGASKTTCSSCKFRMQQFSDYPFARRKKTPSLVAFTSNTAVNKALRICESGEEGKFTISEVEIEHHPSMYKVNDMETVSSHDAVYAGKGKEDVPAIMRLGCKEFVIKDIVKDCNKEQTLVHDKNFPSQKKVKEIERPGEFQRSSRRSSTLSFFFTMDSKKASYKQFINPRYNIDTTLSMVPLLSTSLEEERFKRNAEQEMLNASEENDVQTKNFATLEDYLAFQERLKVGKIVTSLGTQTQTGTDAIIQTSNELLAGD